MMEQQPANYNDEITVVDTKCKCWFPFQKTFERRKAQKLKSVGTGQTESYDPPRFDAFSDFRSVSVRQEDSQYSPFPTEHGNQKDEETGLYSGGALEWAAFEGLARQQETEDEQQSQQQQKQDLDDLRSHKSGVTVHSDPLPSRTNPAREEAWSFPSWFPPFGNRNLSTPIATAAQLALEAAQAAQATGHHHGEDFSVFSGDVFDGVSITDATHQQQQQQQKGVKEVEKDYQKEDGEKLSKPRSAEQKISRSTTPDGGSRASSTKSKLDKEEQAKQKQLMEQEAKKTQEEQANKKLEEQAKKKLEEFAKQRKLQEEKAKQKKLMEEEQAKKKKLMEEQANQKKLMEEEKAKQKKLMEEEKAKQKKLKEEEEKAKQKQLQQEEEQAKKKQLQQQEEQAKKKNKNADGHTTVLADNLAKIFAQIEEEKKENDDNSSSGKMQRFTNQSTASSISVNSRMDASSVIKSLTYKFSHGSSSSSSHGGANDKAKLPVPPSVNWATEQKQASNNNRDIKANNNSVQPPVLTSDRQLAFQPKVAPRQEFHPIASRTSPQISMADDLSEADESAASSAVYDRYNILQARSDAESTYTDAYSSGGDSETTATTATSRATTPSVAYSIASNNSKPRRSILQLPTRKEEELEHSFEALEVQEEDFLKGQRQLQMAKDDSYLGNSTVGDDDDEDSLDDGEYDDDRGVRKADYDEFDDDDYESGASMDGEVDCYDFSSGEEDEDDDDEEDDDDDDEDEAEETVAGGEEEAPPSLGKEIVEMAQELTLGGPSVLIDWLVLRTTT